MNSILKLNAWKDICAYLPLLLFWVGFGPLWIAANGDSGRPWQDGALEVAESTRHAYGLRDDTGRTMDALQVMEHPEQGYLGVYHTLEDGVFRANLARSNDLMRWQFVRGIGGLRTAMPSIYGTSNLGFLVAFEASDAAGEIHLHFDAYADLADLESGRPLRGFDAPILLSSTSVKAEGTPCIESVFLDPDWDHSLVELSFHYFDERRPAVDRQARGWLRNFSHWTAKPEVSLDKAMEQLGVQGNLGDRDVAASPKGRWKVIEGQLVPHRWETWRLFQSVGKAPYQPLVVTTHEGSRAFGNPSVEWFLSPSKELALGFGSFLFGEGASRKERGQLFCYWDTGLRNLALEPLEQTQEMKVSASSFRSMSEGPALAFDQDRRSQWVATDQGQGAWLSYTWAAPRLVEGFQIVWGVGLPEKWKVSALATNDVWQVVWSGERRPPDTSLAWIAPTEARALRLDCLAPAMQSKTHAVREWRIWGQ